MNERRRFMKYAAAAALPATAHLFSGVAHAQDSDDDQLVGSWQNVHSLPFPPGSFREFITFGARGSLHETNSFLHTNSNLDLSAFGLPNVLNASDGVGNWKRAGNRQLQIVFRKMLFDGSRRNIGDLKVTGTATISGGVLKADWLINVVDADDKVIAPFGPATSEGTRIS